MIGAGFIQGMIDSLKNNKRERTGIFEKGQDGEPVKAERNADKMNYEELRAFRNKRYRAERVSGIIRSIIWVIALIIAGMLFWDFLNRLYFMAR